MNEQVFLFKTPHEIEIEMSRKVKTKRKLLKITQVEMAQRSGVSLGSIKRFERTGEISLSSLLKIAMVTGDLKYFEELFKKPEYTNIEEIINEKTR